ncbi:MAG: hypothetical protein V2A62_05655 [Candidatus Woesearchaeota archaeon]
MKTKPRKLHRKGQIHVSETIAVLFIFFVLVAFGMIFYFKYAQYSLKEEQDQLAVARAIRTTSKTLFLPELACTKGESEAEDDCIDMMKLRQVNATFSRHLQEYYYNIFGYAKIKVVKMYPKPEELWIIYDLHRPINNTDETFLPISSTYFIVTLRDEAVEGEKIHYGYGYIEVGVYT